MTFENLARLLLVVVVVVMMPACAFIGGVFKAGVGVGIFTAVLVAGLILFLVTRARA